jgi:hypothetical protein
MFATIQPSPEFRGSDFEYQFGHTGSLTTLCFRNPRPSAARLKPLLYLRKIQSSVLMDSF